MLANMRSARIARINTPASSGERSEKVSNAGESSAPLMTMAFVQFENAKSETKTRSEAINKRVCFFIER